MNEASGRYPVAPLPCARTLKTRHLQGYGKTATTRDALDRRSSRSGKRGNPQHHARTPASSRARSKKLLASSVAVEELSETYQMLHTKHTFRHTDAEYPESCKDSDESHDGAGFTVGSRHRISRVIPIIPDSTVADSLRPYKAVLPILSHLQALQLPARSAACKLRGGSA